VDVLQGIVVVAVIVVVGWAGYKAGWEARERRQKDLEEAAERAQFELSLILVHQDEAALEAADREFGTAAAARMRSMPAKAVRDLRAGRGARFEELSDWLVLRDRRAARLMPRLKTDPVVAPMFRRLPAEGEPAGVG
jgi:hypothetical protein